MAIVGRGGGHKLLKILRWKIDCELISQLLILCLQNVYLLFAMLMQLLPMQTNIEKKKILGKEKAMMSTSLYQPIVAEM